MNTNRSILGGVILAALAALAFGATIPVLAWAGSGVGPFSTAGLLYCGAGAASLLLKIFVSDAGAGFTRRSALSIAMMIAAGAVVGPVLLAWGVQHTDAVTSALLLNGEAACTAVLAYFAYRETPGRRAGAAIALMALGGLALAVRSAPGAASHGLGVLAVFGASLAWAIDNTVSRRLSELKPFSVVAAKGLLGATVTGALAWALDEPAPHLWQAAVLLAAGGTGYGLSLRLYLLAQRRLGAARTASVFSVAPFVGAALGLLVAPGALGWNVLAAGVLFSVGMVLHATERHRHWHRHPPVVHEHAHRHDDGHHSHQHVPESGGEHSHVHSHETMEHSHEHGPDVHHVHSH